jgi:hypothetical protein
MGVTIITTKRKNLKPELTYSTSYTTSNFLFSKFQSIVNVDEFVAATQVKLQNHFGGSFDWEKEMLQRKYYQS